MNACPKSIPSYPASDERLPEAHSQIRPHLHHNSALLSASVFSCPHDGRSGLTGCQGALDTGGRIVLDTPRIWRAGTANSHSQLFLQLTHVFRKRRRFAEIRKGVWALLRNSTNFSSTPVSHSSRLAMACLHLTLCMSCKLFGTANPGPSHDLAKRGAGALLPDTAS